MSWYPDAKDCNVAASDKESNAPFDFDGGTAIFDDDCNSVDDDLHEKLNLIWNISVERKIGAWWNGPQIPIKQLHRYSVRTFF